MRNAPRFLRFAGVLAVFAFPSMALAQAQQCAVPSRLPPSHAEGPTAKDPRRQMPIGGYTLAVTWSPEHCAGSINTDDAFQCGADGTGGGRFGFALHGLWPDGAGKSWPQYCRPAAPLPPAVIRAHLCSTPSAQLIQHEWAKHGTCMKDSPTRFFARSRALYRKLRFPDMGMLAQRRGLGVGDVATAIAAVNPGLRADMMRINATRDGWLSEVWFCLNLRFAPVRCPAGQNGMKPDEPVKIRAR
jgi:ribonuclease T2